MSQPTAPVSLSLSSAADGCPNVRRVRRADVQEIILILEAAETITNKAFETVTEEDLILLREYFRKAKSIFDEKMSANAGMH
jgi:hypothetical protein